MEKYKRLFEIIKNTDFENDKELYSFFECGEVFNTENGLLLFEAVIDIEPEKKIIKNILYRNHKKLVNQNDVNSFCDFLNNLFKNRKIITIAIKLKGNQFIYNGGYNEKTLNIELRINALRIDNMLRTQDKSDFLEFSKQFISLIGHELVHRESFLNIKYEKIRKELFDKKNKKSTDLLNDPSNVEKQKKYYGDNFETMSYAWQIVNSFRSKGISDDVIKNFLQNTTRWEDSYIKFGLGGKTLKDYHTVFGKIENSKELKLLYKYMYNYLDVNKHNSKELYL